MADNPVMNQAQDFHFMYPISTDPFILLIEEVIDFSLRRHNLCDWIPPVNLELARQMNAYTYFNENFALTVAHPVIERGALTKARCLNFDEDRWLTFTDPVEAESYLRYFLLHIYYNNNPYQFEMFSFACYAARIAMQEKHYSLVNVVVWALLAALRMALPTAEYYFVPNMYNQQQYNQVDDQQQYNQVDDQLHDMDEGVGGIADEDDIYRENESILPWLYIDPILLFVEELIEFSLRGTDARGRIPTIDLEILRKAEISYFTENIGRAANHFFITDEAVLAAHHHGFEEERWLELCRPSDARNFQCYFLSQVLDFEGNQNVLRMLSFAGYASRLAMQRDRNSLVNEVVSALVHILRQYRLTREYLKQLDVYASAYNDHHHRIDLQSDDEGVEDVQDEVDDPEENNEDFIGGEAPALPEGVRNETEERSDSQSPAVENANVRSGSDDSEEISDSESSTVGNEANEGSWSDVLEEKNDTTEEIVSHESKEEIGMYAQELEGGMLHCK